jgi:type IV pilus assembly protein PilV
LNSIKYQNKCCIKKAIGMTFIEVLVALVIISTGFLGAVAVQATAKQGSFDAMQRSLASSLAQDIIARMRANNPANLAGYVANDYGDTMDAIPANRCNSTVVPCNAVQMLANDQYEWELALMGGDVTSAFGNAGGLIGATGCILRNGSAMTVVVSWQAKKEMTDAAKANCGAAGSKRRQVVMQAFII